MIRHSVYFRFIDGITTPARDQHVADFAALPERIPEIKAYDFGTVIAGPDAKRGAEYDVAHYVDFVDPSTLGIYIDHPAHQEFIARNKSSWSDVKVIDSRIE